MVLAPARLGVVCFTTCVVCNARATHVKRWGGSVSREGALGARTRSRARCALSDLLARGFRGVGEEFGEGRADAVRVLGDRRAGVVGAAGSQRIRQRFVVVENLANRD